MEEICFHKFNSSGGQKRISTAYLGKIKIKLYTTAFYLIERYLAVSALANETFLVLLIRCVGGGGHIMYRRWVNSQAPRLLCNLEL